MTDILVECAKSIDTIDDRVFISLIDAGAKFHQKGKILIINASKSNREKLLEYISIVGVTLTEM